MARRSRLQALTAIVLTTAVGVAGVRPALAHDATDSPTGGGPTTGGTTAPSPPSPPATPAPSAPTPGPVTTRAPGAPAPAATTPPPLVFPAGRSHRPPALVIGAGAVAIGLGAWLTYTESRSPDGQCTFVPPESRAVCPSPSVGPGLGVALLVLGAGAVIGGALWYRQVTRETQRSVSLLVGPSSMGLRATF
jgi:hypothetical protein